MKTVPSTKSQISSHQYTAPIHLTFAKPSAYTPILIALFLLISCLFKVYSQVIVINQTFSSDTLFIPFSGSTPVYSLKAYGNINLYSDSSLARIVMVDSYGNHWLVFESYPLITDTNSFEFNAGCDETCFLDGIVPDNIRIDIISAFLTLDSLKLDTNYISNAIELQAQAKWNNDSVKIAIMNQRIVEEPMYWRAGRTGIVLKPFEVKEKLLGIKNNTEGLEYYKGGIFERLSNKHTTIETSNVVLEFDWRSRHDADKPQTPYYNSNETGWFTEVKDQADCMTCYVFSPVGSVEARLNLTYNIHNPCYPNIDISEMDVWKCWGYVGCDYGNNQYISFNRLEVPYIWRVIESCFPYDTINVHDSIDCSFKCNDPDKQLCNIEGYTGFPYVSTSWEPDELKKMLITKGPLSCKIKNYTNPPGPFDDHYMVLSGFSIVKEGDTVYKGTGLQDPDIIIEPESRLINTFFWHFKNSWGITYGYNGFMKHENTDEFWAKIDSSDIRVPTGKVNWYGHSTDEMVCSDEDGDGYYWWGLGLHPDSCNCPPGVLENERDCNDNDKYSGPYNLDSLQGLLYSCKSNPCITQVEPLIINDDTVWWSDRHIDRNLIIESGAKLTIKRTTFFTPDAKIVVKPGGILEIAGTDTSNPARLTSGCGEFWGGIEIWGDPVLPQNNLNQGNVTIDKGIIENAWYGIKTSISDYNPDGKGDSVLIYYPTGGIIQATYSTFKNNKTDVWFFPYRDESIANKSLLKLCTFLTDTSLLENAFPSYHLKAEGINELKITGCKFINCRKGVPITAYNNRGSGIYSYNSILTITGFDTIINGNPFSEKGLFENLKYGIYGMHSSLGSSGMKAHENEFRNNNCGFYLSGYTHISPVSIDSNNFIIQTNFGASDPDVQYGMYLNNCTGFKAHQNAFSGNESPVIDRYGIIVNNSGTDNNYIYDNYFEKLTYGLQGLNINANSDVPIEGGVPVFVPTGLRFICNKFQNVGCTNDFLINEDMAWPPTRPGIAYNQRNAANISNPTQIPAGNVFTQTHGDTTDTQYDINISSSVGDILYTHHTSSYPITNLRLKPDDVSNPGKVDYEAFSLVPFVDSTSCPDTFYPVGEALELISALNEAKNKVDSIINLLQVLVDDGSTDTLKSNVENSTSNQSYEIFQDLMSGSPYLSDTVVKTSIEKEEVLPNAMIRDIMVANPQSAKNEELLDAIDQRIDPMPDSMWVEILQGMDTVGAMERLIGELDGWIQNRDLCFNALAELFLFDSIHEWAPDSLINLLDSDEQLSSHYLLAQYYLNHFNFSEAGNRLQSISSQFDLNERQSATHQKILSLVSVLPAIFIDTAGFLIPDSVQQQTLEQIAEADHDLPGAWARNILMASGLLNYHEPIVNESTFKSSRKGKYHWTRSRSIASELKIFPNPAMDYIIVEYAHYDDSDEAHLTLFDSRGIKTGIFSLIKAKDQQVISTSDMPSGTYFIKLCVNGMPKATCKVVIIR